MSRQGEEDGNRGPSVKLGYRCWKSGELYLVEMDEEKLSSNYKRLADSYTWLLCEGLLLQPEAKEHVLRDIIEALFPGHHQGLCPEDMVEMLAKFGICDLTLGLACLKKTHMDSEFITFLSDIFELSDQVQIGQKLTRPECRDIDDIALLKGVFYDDLDKFVSELENCAVSGEFSLGEEDYTQSVKSSVEPQSGGKRMLQSTKPLQHTFKIPPVKNIAGSGLILQSSTEVADSLQLSPPCFASSSNDGKHVTSQTSQQSHNQLLKVSNSSPALTEKNQANGIDGLESRGTEGDSTITSIIELSQSDDEIQLRKNIILIADDACSTAKDLETKLSSMILGKSHEEMPNCKLLCENLEACKALDDLSRLKSVTECLRKISPSCTSESEESNVINDLVARWISVEMKFMNL